MLIVHPYCHREFDQMMRWLLWADELGGAKNHAALMVLGYQVPKEAAIEIEAAAKAVYHNVSSIRAFYEDPRPWPVNSNLMFQRAAWYIAEKVKVPWMWCEPDCIPLVPGWWDLWNAEFQTCKKPIMGCIVSDPRHLTGNAIYAPDMSQYGPARLLTEEVAWDVVDQPKLLPFVHHSEQYQHQWFYGVPPQPPKVYSDAATHFASVEDLKIVRPNAILFHRNKDGTLIERLRERRQSILPAAGPVSAVTKPEKAPVVAPPTDVPAASDTPHPRPSPAAQASVEFPYRCGILVRTFAGDAQWLPYSLASIQKYCRGFTQVVVVAPGGDAPVIAPICAKFDARFMAIEPDPCNGYLAQQITKLKADEYLPEEDFILHHDSDSLFKLPSTPQDFIWPMFGQCPIILMQDYSTFGNGKMPWKQPTELALGQPVQFEFMRRHPLVYPRWLYAKARDHLTQRFSRPWYEWIASLDQHTQGFSEFNFLGALAYANYRYKFRWIDVKRHSPGPDRVHQFYSRDGITADVKAKIDLILSGADLPSQHNYQGGESQDKHIV